MAQEIEVKVKVVTEQAEQGLNKLKTGIQGATNSSKELNSTLSGSKQSEFINQLGDGVGKLNPAFGSAVKGANGLILKMWEMVANPVGAMLAGIVVTAKFLYEAFQNSVAGGKELKAIFAGISAVGEQVKDAMFGLGRALINVTSAAYKFITLDFKGAAESMKEANREASNSYKQLGNAVDGTTAKIIYNLTKQQQANDKAKKIQDLTQSETNKLLVQSREILTDETASMKDKKKALEEVTKAEKESSAEKTRIAAEDLRILKDKAKALGGEAEKKMKGEIRDATIALNVAETENAMTGIKLNKQKKMLGRQEIADAKEKNDAIVTANKERVEVEKEAFKLKEEQQKISYELEKSSVDNQLKNTKLSIDEKRNIVINDNKLSKKDRETYLIDLQNQEILLEETHNKAIADLNKRYDDEKAVRLADTAVKKEELDYNKRVLEIETLAQTELERQTLIEKLDGEHKVRMGIAQKTDDDKKLADAKKLADDQIAIENAYQNAKRNALDVGMGILQQFAGKNKTVALSILAIQKGLAIADVVVGASKAISLATSALAAVPAVIGVVPNPMYAVQAAATLKGIATTKIGAATSIASILASGIGSAMSITGGGSNPASSTTSSGGIATPNMIQASPSVVAPSGVNQLASTLGQNVPIKAYVVSKDMTSQQSLDRNITDTASIG